MKALSNLALALTIALLMPAALAAPPGAQLTDARGDVANGAVDVTAAWFTPYAVPATADPTVDCLVYTCDKDGVRVHIELRDLLAAAPLADSDPNSLRYYYRAEFTPDAWGVKVVVDCVLNLADIGIANVNQLGAETGAGTYCKATSAAATTGDAFDVSGNKISWNDKSQWFAPADFHVDRATSTLTVSLVEDLADVGPGTTFSGLKVTTWISGTAPGTGAFRNVADTTGVGSTFTL